ncbi:MAG TPA: LamG-like jellyroll fold domain-containing protein [Terriglobales bacterium]|nr:LamG-like jellyroll fold domain-containing protein [Terriglobales bacterium]
MRRSIPFVAAIHWSARALLARKLRRPQSWLYYLALASLACATLLGVPSFAQDSPLNFAQNYFVRGDYVVAGAVGLNASFGADGFGTGTIRIPDANPGITGAKSVPAGAEVVAAVLYWQTVEKVGVVPGQLGSGENGFFRPVFQGGPAKGYPITGVPLPLESTVGWSSGGCTGSSTGKLVRTYRANVVSALPRDANGNISANGTYEVRLPNVGNNTPLTLGATLVLIYREFDPTVPLNAIVFYDGAFNPGGNLLTMTQTIQGFYDAANIPVSRITHIVADGKINKFQAVKLDGVTLPSLYGNAEPPFPGYYGPWDNPTWTFPSLGILANFKNPIIAGDASAETQVVPSASNGGCVSWGAVIVATTVQSSDGDGLLDVWKLPKAPKFNPNQFNPNRPGYCDAAVNAGVCAQGDPNWVDLPNAKQGEKDVYVQFDYMCSSPNPDGNTCKTGDGANYSFDPTLQTDLADGLNAVQKVQKVYSAHGITLHVNEQLNPPNQLNVHAIQETSCQDTMVNGQQQLCIFPNPLGTTINKGVVGWPGGLSGFERQLIDPDEPTIVADCVNSPPAEGCVPRFQPAAAPSKHYGLFAHAVGQPKWSIYNGTLMSVKQSGKTVTFTTSTAVGALNVLNPYASGNPVLDPSCPYGRVTVAGAVTNQHLDGTFCVNSPGPMGDSFTITVGGNSVNASYTVGTDPNLAVVPPYTSTASGIADVGGHHFVVSLGLWGNPAVSTSDGQTPAVIASTLMHEQGHAIFTLAHGGPAAGALSSPQLYQSPVYQSVTTNCKVNYLSVMSYSRQLDLLDYSESALPDIDKAGLTGSLSGVLNITHWYVPFPAAVDAQTGKPIGSPAKFLCTGPPAPAGENMTEVTGPADTFSFKSLSGANTDINFDGSLYPNTSENFLGACDWCVGSYDLAQTDATGSYLSSSGPPFGGGGPPFGGGGPPFGGGGPPFGGGGPPFGGGGPPFGGGGPPFGGGGEIDLGTAQSVTPAPQGLAASEGASARTITLTWTKPFGDIGAYNIYRSPGGGVGFTLVTSVTPVNGNPPATSYMDTIACNTNGYQYFVTAVQSASSTNPLAESTPSNTVSTILPDTADPLTGCYIVTNFSSSPANAVQGSPVTVKWTLMDDFYSTNNPVTRAAANTLVAIGPVPNNGDCTAPTLGRTTLLADGTPTNVAVDTFNSNGNQFTFTWNNTDAFCAGSYTFELDLDHVQANPAQSQTASPLQLGIDVNDTDSTPVHITTLGLNAGTVGLPYNSNALTEDGGTAPFTWAFTPAVAPQGGISGLPPGISQQPANYPTLSGTTCAAGAYYLTTTVTDSAKPSNSGTELLTLMIIQAGTSTGLSSNANANTSVFGQPVTFTAMVTPQHSCMPTGSVSFYDGQTQLASAALNNLGTATFMTSALSVGVHNIVSIYAGDNNFVGSQANISPYTVNIYVSDAAPPPYTAVTTLPAGVVGTPYSNTVFEGGGVTAGANNFAWTIVANSVMPGGGSVLPGLSFQPNAPGVTNGTLSGTPTEPGTYTFTAMVTDSAGNTGTQTFTLTITGCATTPPGLVSWYPLNGNALDIRGGKPGTVIGSGSQFVPAEVGQGFKPGPQANGGMVVVPDSPTLALSHFTIGAWVRIDTIDSVETMQIVWKGDKTLADVTTPYSLSVQGSQSQGPGTLLLIVTNGTKEQDVSSKATLTAGIFHYVAATADGTTVNLYIDGQLDTSTPQTVQTFTSTNPLQIGGIQGATTSAFDGVIDELQIWSRALAASEVSGIYNASSDGECQNIWFTENGGVSHIGKITPFGSNTITEYLAAFSSPAGISAGPTATAPSFSTGGNVWFTDSNNNAVGAINSSGANTAVQVPTVTSAPFSITAGPDGNLWFTESCNSNTTCNDTSSNSIGRMTPSGTFTDFPTATGFSSPVGITAGPDGNLWFTESSSGANSIGRISPSGTMTEFPIPTSSSVPEGITAGPDGNVWFTEYTGNKIGVITPAGTISEYTVTTGGSRPYGIATGPDGNLWFTESAGNKIGVITPSGVITEYNIRTASSSPRGITAGPDGNMWFTEYSGNQIGRITPSGVITEFLIPTSSSAPLGIAQGQ